jgi:hypothetical protein
MPNPYIDVGGTAAQFPVHLGNAFAAELHRQREGRRAEHQRPVQITRRYRQRPDGRTARAARRRLHPPPAQPPAGVCDKCRIGSVRSGVTGRRS